MSDEHSEKSTMYSERISALSEPIFLTAEKIRNTKFPRESGETWEKAAHASLGGTQTVIPNLDLTPSLTVQTIYHPRFHNSELTQKCGEPSLTDGQSPPSPPLGTFTTSNEWGQFEILQNSFPAVAPYHRGFLPFGFGLSGWGIATNLIAESVEKLSALLNAEVQSGATALRIPDELTFVVQTEKSPPCQDMTGPKKVKRIFSTDDLSTILKDISLPHITTILEVSSNGSQAVENFKNFLKLRDVELKSLDLHFIWDPLQHFFLNAEEGSGFTIDREIAPLSGVLSDFLGSSSSINSEKPNTRAAVPRFFCADSTWVGEMGGDPVHQLVWIGSVIIEYLRRLDQDGLTASKVLPHLCIQLSSTPQFFLTAALVRATRIVINTIANGIGLGDSETLDSIVNYPFNAPPIHAKCALRNLSKIDPYTNTIRISAQIFGAVIGGASTITSPPFDYLTGMYSQSSLRLTRNTQLIMRDEAHLGMVADPAGGSWFIESLTGQIAVKAWETIQQIEREGGISNGRNFSHLKNLINTTAKMTEEGLATGKRILVGVNKYTDPNQSMGTMVDNNEDKYLPPTPLINAEDTILKKEVINPRRESEPFELLNLQIRSLKKLPIVLMCRKMNESTWGDIDLCVDLFGIIGLNPRILEPVSSVNQLKTKIKEESPDIIILLMNDREFLNSSVIEITKSSKGMGFNNRGPLIIVKGNCDEFRDEISFNFINGFISSKVEPLNWLQKIADNLK